MAGTLPPPAERFDPITARWLPPGGPLHDPERDSVDPAHAEPITLVGPLPRELAAQPSGGDIDPARAKRRRWRVIVGVALFAIVLLLVGGFPLGA